MEYLNDNYINREVLFFADRQVITLVLTWRYKTHNRKKEYGIRSILYIIQTLFNLLPLIPAVFDTKTLFFIEHFIKTSPGKVLMNGKEYSL